MSTLQNSAIPLTSLTASVDNGLEMGQIVFSDSPQVKLRLVFYQQRSSLELMSSLTSLLPALTHQLSHHGNPKQEIEEPVHLGGPCVSTNFSKVALKYIV